MCRLCVCVCVRVCVCVCTLSLGILRSMTHFDQRIRGVAPRSCPRPGAPGSQSKPSEGLSMAGDVCVSRSSVLSLIHTHTHPHTLRTLTHSLRAAHLTAGHCRRQVRAWRQGRVCVCVV